MEEWRDAARGFKSRQSHTGPRAFLPSAYAELARGDGMTFFPITKSKGHFCVLLHSNGKLLWICLSTLLSASLHYCRKIGEIPMIALGALTTHRQTFDIPRRHAREWSTHSQHSTGKT